MKEFDQLVMDGGLDALAEVFNGLVNPGDLSTTTRLMDKADGSLISTFLDKGDRLGVKSKTSLKSSQAMDAIGMLYTSHAHMYEPLRQQALLGRTVNMEFVAPHNRIVLGYTEPDLIVLNIRDNITGEYIWDVEDEVLAASMNKTTPVNCGMCDDFESTVRAMEGIEGVIGVLPDGTWYKLKTDWYCSLHRSKDSISCDKNLMLCCCDQSTDDLRAMFAADAQAVEKIDRFEQHYANTVQTAFNAIKEFHRVNAGLDRKDYAIKASNAFRYERHWFGIVMNLYSNPNAQVVPMIVDAIKKGLNKEPLKFCPC